MRKRDAIGGYFELELPPGHGELYPNALRFQSARAAFFALLQAGRPQRIWMPWYNCETMLEPPAMAGIPVHRYRIDEQLGIGDDIEPGENDWLLYVNYHGLCDSRIDRVLARFPRERVVVDKPCLRHRASASRPCIRRANSLASQTVGILSPSFPLRCPKNRIPVRSTASHRC
jgi:hypothetical protein